MVRYIVLYTTYTVNKDKDRGYDKIYYTIYYIYSKQRQGQRISVFTLNFLTYQPGGLVPMEFLQVPP
jgi:hypothetical protein